MRGPDADWRRQPFINSGHQGPRNFSAPGMLLLYVFRSSFLELIQALGEFDVIPPWIGDKRLRDPEFRALGERHVQF